MKVLFALIVFSMSSAVLACQQEAQIIASIYASEANNRTSCKAYIDLSQVQFFAPSTVCPLDLKEIADEGVEVGFRNFHDCRLGNKDQLNGIVVRNESGVLVLE